MLFLRVNHGLQVRLDTPIFLIRENIVMNVGIYANNNTTPIFLLNGSMGNVYKA